MGILNKLWNKLWSAEEAKKAQVYQEKVSAVVAEAEKEKAKLTYLQQLAMRHGGPDRSDEYSQQAQTLSMQAQYQQMKMQALAQAHQPQAIGVYTPPNQMSVVNGTPSWWQSSGLPTSVLGSTVYSSHTIFNDHNQETFFKALRGIEEAAAKRPEGNHDYDDLSYPLQDMRKFNVKEISLLALMSFCLCNVMEVEPVVALLEGYGMTVVD